jgi:hypothetical protein
MLARVESLVYFGRRRPSRRLVVIWYIILGLVDAFMLPIVAIVCLEGGASVLGVMHRIRLALLLSVGGRGVVVTLRVVVVLSLLTSHPTHSVHRTKTISAAAARVYATGDVC